MNIELTESERQDVVSCILLEASDMRINAIKLLNKEVVSEDDSKLALSLRNKADKLGVLALKFKR